MEDEKEKEEGERENKKFEEEKFYDLLNPKYLFIPSMKTNILTTRVTQSFSNKVQGRKLAGYI